MKSTSLAVLSVLCILALGVAANAQSRPIQVNSAPVVTQLVPDNFVLPQNEFVPTQGQQTVPLTVFVVGRNFVTGLTKVHLQIAGVRNDIVKTTTFYNSQLLSFKLTQADIDLAMNAVAPTVSSGATAIIMVHVHNTFTNLMDIESNKLAFTLMSGDIY